MAFDSRNIYVHKLLLTQLPRLQQDTDLCLTEFRRLFSGIIFISRRLQNKNGAMAVKTPI